MGSEGCCVWVLIQKKFGDYKKTEIFNIVQQLTQNTKRHMEGLCH